MTRCLRCSRRTTGSPVLCKRCVAKQITKSLAGIGRKPRSVEQCGVIIKGRSKYSKTQDQQLVQ